ncbi:HAD-IIA family hydrolase, partial [Boudabousia marimammalium]
NNDGDDRRGRGGFGRDDRGGSRDGGRGGRGFNRDDRGGDRGGRGFDRDDQGARRFDERRESQASRAARSNNEPEIPGDIKAEDLDRQVQAQLRTLSGVNAETVARHLVAAGRLIDDEPELAYQHAQAAAARAGRVDVVREAAALTAYAVGKYDEALKEVRAVRRLSGSDALRAVEADCERAAGKPEKALEIINETDFESLDTAEQAELIIVASAARADLGENEAALVIVDDALSQLPEDYDDEVRGRLMSVKVDRLRELGREAEADELEAAIPEIPEDIDIYDLEEIVESDIDDVRSAVRGCKVPLAEAYDAALYDLDGVCYRGNEPIPNAAEFINASREENGLQDIYVTNNASRTPAQVAEKLQGLGIEALAENVMTAAMDIAGIMAGDLEAGAKILVIGGDGLREAISDAGFTIVESADDNPDAVVQGWSADIDWARLSEASYAINNGARFYASNTDASLPQERGFALGNGSLVKAVEHCTGRNAFAGGKPFPGIYRKAAELAGDVKQVLTVGDRLDTDIQGARAARYLAMHVLTGVSTARDIVLSDYNQRPAYLAIDMRQLAEPHPHPRHHTDGHWTCGSSESVHVDRWGNIFIDEDPLTEGSAITLDNYRAVVAAAWETIDNGHKVRCPNFTVVTNEEGNVLVPVPERETEAEEEAVAEELTSEEQVETEENEEVAQTEEPGTVDAELVVEVEESAIDSAEVEDAEETDAVLFELDQPEADPELENLDD